MSTKAIREALDAAAMVAPDTNNEDLARKVAAAWDEVEAIERVACGAALLGSVQSGSDAMLLLKRIAKGAP